MRTLDFSDGFESATEPTSVAYAASAVTNTPSGNLAAVTVQAALNELQSDVDTRALASDLTAHISDSADAHAASAITNTPLGNLAATTAQGALNELQADIDTRAPISTTVTLTDAQDVSNKTFDACTAIDSGWSVISGGDPTKHFRVDLSGISTGQTRVWLVPDVADTFVGKATPDVFTNKSYDADGTGNVLTNVDNGNIKAAAGIELGKLAALTASRATVTDGSGFIVAAATTATELGYVSGVTSAIQTQFGTKVTGPASATDNGFVKFDGTTGKLVKNSAATVAAATEISGVTGSWTITLANTSNCSGTAEGSYIRLGARAFFYGTVAVTPAANSAFSFELNLPVASNFGSSSQAGGAAVSNASQTLRIEASSANDTLLLSTNLGMGTSALTFTFSGGYQIV